jgi:hypothetical protein
MNDNSKSSHEESLTSGRTEALFVALTFVFLLLTIWRVNNHGWGFLSFLCLILFVTFFFYSFNYRKLKIHLTTDSLKLIFGIFHWTVPVEDIESIRLDDPPPIKKYGGAGIHFMFVDSRYRASFNFLEYPRVVIALKRKGRVKDISFSTRQPEEIIRLIGEAKAARAAA